MTKNMCPNGEQMQRDIEEYAEKFGRLSDQSSALRRNPNHTSADLEKATTVDRQAEDLNQKRRDIVDRLYACRRCLGIGAIVATMREEPCPNDDTSDKSQERIGTSRCNYGRQLVADKEDFDKAYDDLYRQGQRYAEQGDERMARRCFSVMNEEARDAAVVANRLDACKVCIEGDVLEGREEQPCPYGGQIFTPIGSD